jgi:hypothetical protein
MTASPFRALALAIVLLVGCAAPRAALAPDGGQIRILGPRPGFSLDTLPASWVIEGTPGRASVVDKDGVPALRLIGGPDAFVLARLTRARLLATPYLSWAWNMGAHEGDTHPVGLVVGFQGANPAGHGRGGEPWRWLGTALPPHDRRLAIAWGARALKRRSFDDRGADAGPRYIQRGGRENTGSWWLETVDLADLYGRAWPGDDPGRVGIVFIGLTITPATEPARAPARGHVSGVLLSR